MHAVKRTSARTHTHTLLPCVLLTFGWKCGREEGVERATRPEFTGVHAIEVLYVHPLLLSSLLLPRIVWI